MFVPFDDVGESTLDQDKELYQYSYEDIMQMLRDNSKLTNVDEEKIYAEACACVEDLLNK